MVIDAQLAPFQRRTSGASGALWMSLVAEPTAQTSAVPVASTAARVSYVATVGAAETCQVPPVRWSTSARRLLAELGSTYVPTAQTLLPATATPERLLMLAGLPSGVASRVHAVPFQWAASVSVARNPEPRASPTAQTSVAETASTA